MTSRQFEDALLEQVKKYPILYRVRMKSVKFMSQKYDCWNKIGAALNRPPDECKSKFRNIRDNYIKNKKKKINGGGPAVSKYDDERLNFLSEPYEEPTNPDDTTKENFIVYEITNNNIKEEYDSTEEVPLSESPFILGTSEDANAGPTFMSDPIASYEPNQLVQQNMTVQDQSIGPELQVESRRVLKRKRDSIIDELRKDREERNAILEKLVNKVTGTGQTPTHSFFSCMADIVCQFPPEKIAELRNKICIMVSTMELSLLKDKTKPGS
uniref:MADF domain-containing protein n=1 Tax=Heliothis virescens TaxID=7102 RepID=A0A2A4JNQ5_HELVI